MAKRINPSLLDVGVSPELGHSRKELFTWLEESGLTSTGNIMDIRGSIPKSDLYHDFATACATNRSATKRKKRDALKEIKDKFEKSTLKGVNNEAIWNALKDPDEVVRALDWNKLPADAMAFYRPFHYPPFDQWGIYLLAKPLLNYHQNLKSAIGSSTVFSPEILMHLIIFEVFHHEFFHHIVESTSTMLEIISASKGDKKPIYIDYSQRAYSSNNHYPHAPLEEALANAYAYNALSFICRIKLGYKTTVVKAYQAAVRQHWNKEPPGYKDAAYYIDGAYIQGGANLLTQILDVSLDTANTVPLSCLAKMAMPSGFTALVAKPDIPTYLVGSDEDIAEVNKLVPAINEAYTQLFWPFNTSTIEDFISQKREEEKKAKKK